MSAAPPPSGVVGGRPYAAEVLEMAATSKDTTKRITVYPAAGQTAVPASFNRCQEHPTPFGGPCAPTQPVQQVGSATWSPSRPTATTP
jgi:hypothetical protein